MRRVPRSLPLNNQSTYSLLPNCPLTLAVAQLPSSYHLFSSPESPAVPVSCRPETSTPRNLFHAGLPLYMPFNITVLQIFWKLTCFISNPGTGGASSFSRIGLMLSINSLVFLAFVWASTLSHPTASKCTRARPLGLCAWSTVLGRSTWPIAQERGPCSCCSSTTKAVRKLIKSASSCRASFADMSLGNGRKQSSVTGFLVNVSVLLIGGLRVA